MSVDEDVVKCGGANARDGEGRVASALATHALCRGGAVHSRQPKHTYTNSKRSHEPPPTIRELVVVYVNDPAPYPQKTLLLTAHLLPRLPQPWRTTNMT